MSLTTYIHTHSHTYTHMKSLEGIGQDRVIIWQTHLWRIANYGYHVENVLEQRWDTGDGR